MYSIGTFSKLVGVSVKTLRYYHEIELFSPSFIDPETKYRYYSFNKFSEIETIKLFKSFGLSLNDIKEIITGDFKNIESLLKAQQKALNEDKLRIEEQLSLIEEMLQTGSGKVSDNYRISHVKFEEREQLIVLSVKETIDMNNINSLVKKLFEKAYAYHVELVGNLMVTLRGNSPLNEVEVMMAVNEKSINQSDIADFKVIEGGNYAYLYFKGLYSDLYNAYEKLNSYSTNKNSFMIEEYIEGLLPESLDKPLLVRPNIEKHPSTFVTKLLLKL